MFRVVKRFILAMGLLVAVVCAVVVGRAYYPAPSLQVQAGKGEPVAVDADAAAAHLALALQCRTISHMDRTRIDGAEFQRLHAIVQASFPKVHERLQRDVVNGLSLLYTWPGSDTSLKPVLLLAHMDVVAADESGGGWMQPPFGGVCADGCIWGRGTLDDKGSMFAILEAAEALLAAGFAPRRTVYLAFGHDEEIGGAEGAAHIAALLRERGVQAECSLDEGLVITTGIVPGVRAPLALVALAEKGYTSYELLVKQKGGHSSQPPPETGIDILAGALTRIRQHPFPARMDGPMRLMFDYVRQDMDAPYRVLFSNFWLFGGIIQRELEKMPATNAGLRTTSAATIIHAGEKDNILPALARAVINCRLYPGDGIEPVRTRLQQIVADPRVEITAVPGAEEASRLADPHAPAFGLIARSVRQVWPGVLVAPSLDIGGTDSKHYEPLTENQYRFAPFWFTDDELSMIHGVNEHVKTTRYLEAIQFYAQFIRNSSEPR